MSAATMFWDAFGRGTQYRAFSEADGERLAEKLPPVMLQILKAEGWCSYRDQSFWLCDPEDWVGIIEAWEPEIPDSYIVGRTGFGDFLFTDGLDYFFVMVHDSRSLMMAPDGDVTLSEVITSPKAYMQTLLPDMMVRAHGAGPLEWDEMYTFVPAIALGGSFETSKIEPVKARGQLLILASLAPLQRA